jgi:hypothetical protein
MQFSNASIEWWMNQTTNRKWEEEANKNWEREKSKSFSALSLTFC